jgi:hypothetical protein
MDKKRDIWVWVGVIVVIVVVIGAFIAWFLRSGVPQPSAPVPVHAQAGQVVSGFPLSLILGAATGTDGAPGGVTNSYSITYSSSTKQYTAEWTSTSTPAALYAAYDAYITAHGWTLTNHADTAAFKGLYAVNGSSSLNVVLMPLSGSGAPAASGGSKVSVSYVGQ